MRSDGIRGAALTVALACVFALPAFAQDNAPTAADASRVSTGTGSVSMAVGSGSTPSVEFSTACLSRILVYDNNPTYHNAAAAVSGLSLTPTLANSSNFVSLLAGGGWDLVIMDLPSTEPSGAWQTGLINYIAGGGKVIHTGWNLSSHTAALQAAFELTITGTHQTQTLYAWTPNPLWTTPNSVPQTMNVWADIWGTNGFYCTPTGGAQAVGGFTSSPGTQGGIIVGHGGKTIFCGLVFDDYNPSDIDADGTKDIVELIQNMIHSMCPAGGGGGGGPAVPAASNTTLVIAGAAIMAMMGLMLAGKLR